MDGASTPLQLSSRVREFTKPTIFEETALVSIKLGTRNMAQGFPDWPTPQFLLDALTKAISSMENQYVRCGGHPKYIEALAKFYSPIFNRTLNPLTEVTIGNGATQILSNAMCAFLEPGDEVIVIEPFFEFYVVEAKIFGGNLRYFTMDPPAEGSDAWTINFEKLEALFNEKTRIIIVNTPHNPTGKVVTLEEYQKLQAIMNKFPRVILLSDEVYEFMTFDSHKHVRPANLPGMWERTISIYSAGKTFSCTGWRIGYAIGDANLIKGLTAAQQWITFNANRPIQVALTEAMQIAEQPYEGEKDYYVWLDKTYQRKRDELMTILKNAPFNWRVLVPEGGFFALADITNAIKDIPRKYFYAEGKAVTDGEKPLGGSFKDLEEPDYAPDYAFYRWLSYEYLVTPVPLGTFYDLSLIHI
eukprot:TRINITY_DN4054_c0_g3_i7.p2 TRINITY_DN4054_c0_g3~~TRINITY_DN4054_c0_g3_i7.p2  ORF type:complete len:415 (+),score=127.01 TRINITY_DN4054_c0_g3_i7:67-1311(+)